ncbi:MAG: ABC transporter permease [Bacteroidetes bacterium]|nr:ABC transporter permease [Bacteroidota bacterium]
MNLILTIIRKELLDSLRDRKTLMSAIVIPAIAMPLLMLGIIALQKGLNDKEKNKTLKVALVNAPADFKKIIADPKITLIQNAALTAAKDSVASESFDALLAFPAQSTATDTSGQVALDFYFKSTNVMVSDRMKEKISLYKEALLADRFQKLQLPKDLLQPVKVNNQDLASTKEQLGVYLGGFLPYFFLLFCFIGCMYPAIDLFTGEKERGTLETLLTVPASRLQILIGKMATIALVGVVAACMTLGGMFVAMRVSTEIPAEVLKTVSDLLSIKFVLMLFAMLFPLSIFFAGILSAITMRASTFKEAQSYVTPLTFVIIVPAMIALMPGIKLSWATTWIPILNISLATKEIVAGTIIPLQYVAIVLSLILFAFLALLISVRQFSKEGNILK